MPFIDVSILEGRTIEEKQAIIKKLTEALVSTISCPHDTVHVTIKELKAENIGKGGKMPFVK